MSRGKYCVELRAELPYDPDDVDTALERLGYEVVDLDQWGRSYGKREDPRHTAEMDELDETAGYVRLVLRRGDCEPSEVASAESEVESVYARLQPMCRTQAEEGYREGSCPDYGRFDDPASPGLNEGYRMRC